MFGCLGQTDNPHFELCHWILCTASIHEWIFLQYNFWAWTRSWFIKFDDTKICSVAFYPVQIKKNTLVLLPKQILHKKSIKEQAHGAWYLRGIYTFIMNYEVALTASILTCTLSPFSSNISSLNLPWSLPPLESINLLYKSLIRNDG